MSSIINTTLENVFKTTPMGGINNSIGSLFYGINHRRTPSAIPINKDDFGLTFFTRPQLNMTTQNLRAERRFIPLLTNEAASIQRIIRCYLDPRLSTGDNSLISPFVDNENAFMPLLTNHLISSSGWPDISLDTYTSKPGAYKEVFSQVDSTADIYSAYDITATFRNMVGDPITNLMYIWSLYQSLVFQGNLVPYPDYLVKNEYDYNTRIYRLVMDSNRRYVTNIACTGASFPTSVPFGAKFNFESDKPLNLSNAEIQISFKCMGARYNDPIIVHDFNKVVGIFNPNMRTDKLGQLIYPSNIKKIPIEALAVFNNRGYARIDPDTNELEWYVSSEDYAREISNLKRHLDALS
jgi:hypothetical protein